VGRTWLDEEPEIGRGVMIVILVGRVLTEEGVLVASEAQANVAHNRQKITKKGIRILAPLKLSSYYFNG
jgi:hypothetical protein